VNPEETVDSGLYVLHGDILSLQEADRDNDDDDRLYRPLPEMLVSIMDKKGK
jgi:hypothetical protein